MIKLLDANIIIRYFISDHPKHTQHVIKFFTNSQSRLLVITDMVFAEIIWTLLSFYKIPKEKIVRNMKSLFKVNAIQLNQKLLEDSLNIFSQNNIDYIDAYIIVYGKENSIDEVVSFDRDFDQIKSINRIEP